MWPCFHVPKAKMASGPGNCICARNYHRLSVNSYYYRNSKSTPLDTCNFLGTDIDIDSDHSNCNFLCIDCVSKLKKIEKCRQDIEDRKHQFLQRKRSNFVKCIKRKLFSNDSPTTCTSPKSPPKKKAKRNSPKVVTLKVNISVFTTFGRTLTMKKNSVGKNN